jgi:hypothetical protein
MTGTTASDYDPVATDLVVRTLGAVADATPVDPGPVDVDLAIEVLPGADIDESTRRARPARWVVVGLATAAAVALVIVAVWTRVGGQVETAPSDEGPVETAPSDKGPGDAAPRPLAEEQVVARGEIDGKPWRLSAQPFENGIMCLELTGGGGGCGGMPTAEKPLGSVFYLPDGVDGSYFVFGVVESDAAEVMVEIASGEELSLETSGPAFGARFFATPVSPAPDAVTVRDEDGEELQRVEL